MTVAVASDVTEGVAFEGSDVAVKNPAGAGSFLRFRSTRGPSFEDLERRRCMAVTPC
jgi:hypothetical protein